METPQLDRTNSLAGLRAGREEKGDAMDYDAFITKLAERKATADERRKAAHKCRRDGCRKLNRVPVSAFCSQRCWHIFLRAKLRLCRCGCGKPVITDTQREHAMLCYAAPECLTRHKPSAYYRRGSASLPPAEVVSILEKDGYAGVKAWCKAKGRRFDVTVNGLNRRGHTLRAIKDWKIFNE